MYHKSIAVLLLITLFVFSGITFVGNKAGYDSFWFCIITILASTGFSLFIGAASRSFPILDIADDVNRLAVRFGVNWFKKLLSISRWDLITKQLRPTLNSKTPPLSLLQSFQSNFVAHSWGFLVHLWAAIFAECCFPADNWILSALAPQHFTVTSPVAGSKTKITLKLNIFCVTNHPVIIV